MAFRWRNNVSREENYDLIIAGRESIDYNGAMVPGMLSAFIGYNFVTNCVALEIKGNFAKASREIDGGMKPFRSFH